MSIKPSKLDGEWQQRCETLEADIEQTQVKGELLVRVLQRLIAIAEGIDQELDKSLPALLESARDFPPTPSFITQATKFESGILQVLQRRDDGANFCMDSFAQLVKQLEMLATDSSVSNRASAFKKKLEGGVERYYEYPQLLMDLVDIQRLVLAAQKDEAEAAAKNEQTTVPVSSAVVAGIESAVSASTQGGASDQDDICQHVGKLLLRLLEQLTIPAELLDRARQLRARIESGFEWADIDKVFQEAVDLAVKATLHDQEDFESYLRGLNGQLENLQSFLGDEEKQRNAARRSVEQLDSSLREDVARVEDCLSESNDLNILKTQIRAQMQSIVSVADRFKVEQSEREAEAEVRLRALQNTIEEMESRTSDLQSHLEEQRLRAMSDPLTGLPNRAAYDECIRAKIDEARNNSWALTLVVCDLDHFKRVNDNYGHLAGDKVLRLAAKILRGALRSNDFIGRYGGEEFVIVLSNTTSVQALDLMDKLRRVTSQSPFNFKGQPVRVTMSFGIAQSKLSEKPEELFARADKALYQAKANGRNQCVVSSSELSLE